MTIVPIHDKNGVVVDKLEINDNLEFISGRVTKGDKLFYKGLGATYKCHVLPPITDTKQLDGYTILDDKLNIFYLGPLVSKDCFAGKSGLFQEVYQPTFTDFIGSCGVKELSIIENSEEFERSSAEVIKAVNYDKENGQYYFILNYKCKRVKYKDVGDPKELYDLLEYMINSNWNFVWDKNSIEDISYNGLVTDVGDIFMSKRLDNKLGTIYSVLHSLAKGYPDKYKEFCRFHNIPFSAFLPYVMGSAHLLKKFGVDTSEFYISEDPFVNMKHIVLNYVVSGRNCGDCCMIDIGEQIREQYIQQTKKQMKIA